MMPQLSFESERRYERPLYDEPTLRTDVNSVLGVSLVTLPSYDDDDDDITLRFFLSDDDELDDDDDDEDDDEDDELDEDDDDDSGASPSGKTRRRGMSASSTLKTRCATRW